MEDFQTAFQRRVSFAPTIPTAMRMTSGYLLPFNRVRNIHWTLESRPASAPMKIKETNLVRNTHRCDVCARVRLLSAGIRGRIEWPGNVQEPRKPNVD